MRLRFSVVALAAALQAPAASDASVVVALSIEELFERSEVVCLVRVDATASRWSDGRIVTDVRATCERAIAGARDGEVVEFFTLGGRVGDIGAHVPGEPSFRRGDRAIVFLSEAAGSLRVTGMSQGAAFVTGRSGAEQVGPSGRGATLVRLPAERATSWLPEPRPLRDVLEALEGRASHAP